MKTSDKGLLEICESEGIVPAPYLDSRKIWTVYVGHTAMAGGLDPSVMPRGMPADMDAALDAALRVFAEDVVKYERRVLAATAGIKLTQHQFDALVSWDFNTGGALWKNRRTGKPCQLIQQIQRGDMSGDGFMGWLRPPEINGRRKAEQRLFQTGDYDHNGDRITIWKVSATGRRGGAHSTISGADLLKRMRAA